MKKQCRCMYTLCGVMGLRWFAAPKYHYFLLKMASSIYFFAPNLKMASKNTPGHSLMTQNAPSRLHTVYQVLQVSKMEHAKRGHFWRAKSEKRKKKNLKIFYCPKWSVRSCWSIMYIGLICWVRWFHGKTPKTVKMADFCHFWPVLDQ